MTTKQLITHYMSVNDIEKINITMSIMGVSAEEISIKISTPEGSGIKQRLARHPLLNLPVIAYRVVENKLSQKGILGQDLSELIINVLVEGVRVNDN